MSPVSIAIADERDGFLELRDAELPIYSLTKPVIASAVFAAGVEIERPVADWIGADIVPRAADITVAQLLNHTSGLSDYGALPEYSRAIQSGEPPWSDEVFAAHTLRKPLLFEPGEGWAYSNPGYWLLSRIVQLHTGSSFSEVVARFVTEPLGLSNTRVARGQFADDLPGYPAGWVWHGLLTATASDMVRFMMSPLVEPLLRTLTKVPGEHAGWIDPHYGYGLMVEPGLRYGHNGSGPRYSASCFRFIDRGMTGCVLKRADAEDAAMHELLERIRAIR